MKPYEIKLLCCVVILGFFSYYMLLQEKKIQEENQQEELKEALLVEKLSELSLEAQSMAIFNATKNKHLYGKSEGRIMPLASLGKSMTVITALGTNIKEDYTIISIDALQQEGGGILSVGEKWKTEDLARFTLLSSSNEGAYALAESNENFINTMNEKARKIGMRSTTFSNTTGLDMDIYNPGSYGSAKDANALALYALLAYPDIFNITTQKEALFTSVSGKTHFVQNTNTALEKIPNIVFSKTGFTKLAGGNLTVIFKDTRGDLFSVTVLGSSMEGRFKDVEKIVNLLYTYKYDL